MGEFDFADITPTSDFMTDSVSESLHKKPRRLQIVFLATGAFAVPSMRALCESGLYEIVCLVTNPQKHDRSGCPIITPARRFAEQYNIAISEKEDVHSQEFFDFIYLVRPDLLFVCDFGQILSQGVLKGPLLGGINLHGSLLPKYRGAAPVHWAIMNGETITGVSVIHMTPQVDAGPVIAQSAPIPIGPRETVGQLEERLAEYGAELIFDVVQKMACNEDVRIIPQIHAKASKAPRLKKQSGLVDWTLSSKNIFNNFRAMSLWPKFFTDWLREDGSTLRLILDSLDPLNDELRDLIVEDFSDPVYVEPVLTDAKMENLAVLRSRWVDSSSNMEKPRHDLRRFSRRPSWWLPGTVIRAREDELIVAAGEGALRINRLQPVGKKIMDAIDFLRGYPIKQGDRLGSFDVRND